MNWLTWRQYRTSAIAGYAAMGAMALVFLLTGLQILNAFTDSGLKSCIAQSGRDCNALQEAFGQRFETLQWFLPLAIITPALIGMFWGAPLVARELENGTHRLAWTQGVSRQRWLTSKLIITIGSAALVSGILAVALTWWISLFVDAKQWVRFDYGNFDLGGFVPVAYTIFAVALGVALGTMFRKTLPAAFATLAVFGAIRIPIMLFLRKNYMAAKEVVTPFKGEGPIILGSRGHDWILTTDVIDKTGNSLGPFAFSQQRLAAQCPDLFGPGVSPDKADLGQCLRRLGIQTVEVFHPADRFWTFQAIEAGIFLVLAAALIGFVIWRVKRVS